MAAAVSIHASPSSSAMGTGTKQATTNATPMRCERFRSRTMPPGEGSRASASAPDASAANVPTAAAARVAGVNPTTAAHTTPAPHVAHAIVRTRTRALKYASASAAAHTPSSPRPMCVARRAATRTT